MEKHCPRVMLAGTASGCGKTTLTSAILSGFLQEKQPLQAWKCGPDYIDPMFHREVLQLPTGNLDSYFYDENTLAHLMGEKGNMETISLVEGVMGYYDGQSVSNVQGSSFDLAKILQIPSILVLPCKGTAHSILPVIQGFLSYQKNSGISAVILNQTSQRVFEALKPIIEEQFGISALGYFPKLSEEFHLKSRHLGLLTPNELDNSKEILQKLGVIARETLDFDKIKALAHSAPLLSYHLPKLPEKREIHLAVAKDSAFSFYYQENLDLLEKLGAKLHFFSPISDTDLPKDIDGLYLGGGYPELHLKKLSENHRIKGQIKDFLQKGMPCIAECGGFLYLNQEISGYPMVGFLSGVSEKQDKLKRFGYIQLKSKNSSILGDKFTEIKGHEFHYYDCLPCGSDFIATKPDGRHWETGICNAHFYGGFPHLPFYSNLDTIDHFMKICWEKRHEPLKSTRN